MRMNQSSDERGGETTWERERKRGREGRGRGVREREEEQERERGEEAGLVRV